LATFAKGHANKRTHADNAALIRKLQPDNETTTRPGVVTFTYSAADWITLRGVPAIGIGVQGAIAGTRPDQSQITRDT
jgi:hypothetical protein